MSGAYTGVLAFVEGTEPAETVVLLVVASVYAVVPTVLVYLAISRDEKEGDSENDVSTEKEGRSA